MTSSNRLLPLQPVRHMIASSVVFAIVLLNLRGEVASSFSSIRPENRSLCQQGSTIPANRVNTTERLQALRQEMKVAGLNAYLIVMTDEHGSYSSSGHYALVNYTSGFSGSNGYAVVTENKSAVWTDGRYFLQADQQMDCQWILMKMADNAYPQYAWDWLKDELGPGRRVGAYPNIVDQTTWSNYEKNLKNQGQEFVSVPKELVDKTWTSRPKKPNDPLSVHNLTYAGKTWQVKLSEVRSALGSSVEVLVVTVLEQVAWLFNLRGSDKSNSLFYAYAIVHRNKASLYVTNYTSLISDETVQVHLNIRSNGTCLQPDTADCVNVYEYNDVYDQIRSLTNVTIWVDPTANYAIFNATSHLEGSRTVQTSPIELMKSIKNEVERVKFANCIFRDSAAVIVFAQFMEDRIRKGEKNWTEISATEKLLTIRQSDSNFRGVSFSTIAAFGPNAAVIHYRPDPSTDAPINDSSVFLLDSGGQYLDGTTDVTRTFHYGQPDDDIKEAYTRVLMGQIDLALAVWPEGLHGYELDIVARLPLHQHGWDYNHGTGHGIGYYLSVHEGPGRIARGYSSTSQPLAEGMFFSDEPGYYEDNKFGIRLESLMTVVAANTTRQFGTKKYLTFRTLTLVPYENKLIKYEMLSIPQKEWLNAYNERCSKEMGDYLMKELNNHPAHQWVLDRTQPIPLYVGSQGHLTSGPLMIVLSLFTSSAAILLHNIN